MNARQLATLLKDTPARLLDVRSASEFENAHIAGAYNVPLDQLGQHVRELRAARVLDGGMAEWHAGAFAVRRVRERVSLERQVRILAGAMVASGAFAALTVSPWFAIVPALVGSGLVFAGLSNTCAMGMLLARLPYNRSAVSCDTEAIVRQFLAHEGPRG